MVVRKLHINMLPTFPDFRPLSLADKKLYDQLVAEYPPLADISFATLHIWWNLEKQLSVSTLNGNLVINYHLPFDRRNSGYCLIGTHRVDESLEAIFQDLKKRGRSPRLVHVPEFVIKKIRHRGSFSLTEELDYNEYILDAYELAKLEGSLHRSTRREINHFLKDVGSRKLSIRPLDLEKPGAADELYKTLMKWDASHPSKNDPDHAENLAIKAALEQAVDLELEHLGLYVDDVLHAFLLYHRPAEKEYYLMNHLRTSHEIPYMFDFMIHHLASQALQNDVRYLNIEMDLGIENLRSHKMRLRPVEFFRKYTVRPAEVAATKPVRQRLSQPARQSVRPSR